jgi:hypothetical protein
VGEHDRVAVDVDDAGVGRRRLRDLVGVVRAGQPGADIEELPDALPGRQVPDRTAEEPPVGPDPGMIGSGSGSVTDTRSA